MLAMCGSLLVLIWIGGDVDRVAVDGAIDGHADRSATFLRQLTEQAGGPGQQGEAAQQLDRQAEIGQRGTANTGSVQRQPATQNLIMDPPDRLEELQVRPAQPLLSRDLDQYGRSGVFLLMHRMTKAGHIAPIRTGGAHCLQSEFIPLSVVGRELARMAAQSRM